MRNLILLAAVLAVVACKEKDLTNENPAPDPENISVAMSFFYNDSTLYRDSLMSNWHGQQFYITELKVAFSNFHYYEREDTLATMEEPFVISMEEPGQKLVALPPGGYSGHYALRLGLDSLESVEFIQSNPGAGNEVVDANMLRNDGRGIDNIVIKGKLLDPDDPMDTTGTIDLEYRLGTHVTSLEHSSVLKNFNLVKTNQVEFVMHIDIGHMLKGLDMVERPKVTTDRSNIVDYTIAQEMADSLRVRLF